MSENEKDNKDFEFIKEQVIEKKHKKIKKWLLPLLMTAFMAILFGTIAAVTFVIAEPRLYKFLHKEEETKTPVSFPSGYPEDPTIAPTEAPVQEPEDKSGNTTSEAEGETPPEKETVFVETSIDADIEDYVSMYNQLRTVAYTTNKSLVDISSIINVIDWYGNSVEQTIKTTGVIVANNTADYLILVSLDRVKDASSIKMEITNTIAVDAIIQDYDSELNIAIIAVDVKDIPPAFINNIQVAPLGESYTITVGSPIIALGSPNGHPRSMELGIVTSRGSWANITDNKLDLFNTNIEDNENSDGIIVNLQGEVIGLITRTLKENGNENLNTVIGISKVMPIISCMVNLEPRIYFGVKTDDMTEATKLEHNITNGIYVNEVQANSPAFEAGMKNGDIILQIGDQVIMNTYSFYNTISGHKPEDKIIVKIKRTVGTTEKEMDLEITLDQKEK